MTISEGTVDQDAETTQLRDEVRSLRRELLASRATSARALARATRLAQLVSALGQLTDVAAVFERAVCEVAEQFSTDIAVVLTPHEEGVRVSAQWGLAARHVPEGTCPVPPVVHQLTTVFPVVAGPVSEYGPPEWLAASRPRHLAWGLLTGRNKDLGYLILARRADQPFESAEVQELGAVVSRIAMAVDNGQLYLRIQEQLRRMRQLNQVTSSLASLVDRERAVRSIAGTLVTEVPLEGAAVYVAGDAGFELAASAGAVGDPPQRLPDDHPGDESAVTYLDLRTGTSLLGRLLLSGVPREGSEAWTFMEHLADISSLVLEKALLFHRVRTQAETDSMTGLPNRMLFMSRLASALARCQAEERDLAVIFVDLDGFKAVNDTHGHDAGDQLLIQVARRLTAAVRLPDTVARLGGDEFVVLCEDVTGDELHEVVVPRIQRAMDAPYVLDVEGEKTQVTAGGSLGIGTGRETRYVPEVLLRTADTAMYAAKQARKAARR